MGKRIGKKGLVYPVATVLFLLFILILPFWFTLLVCITGLVVLIARQARRR